MRNLIGWCVFIAALSTAPLTSRAQSPAADKKIASLVLTVDGQSVGTVSNMRLVANELANLSRSKAASKKSLRVDPHGITVAVVPTNNGFLKEWYDAARGESGSAHKTAMLNALNASGTRVTAWRFTAAWPTSYTAAQKTPKKLLTETLTLRFENFEHVP
jgi:hypothetical protein